MKEGLEALFQLQSLQWISLLLFWGSGLSMPGSLGLPKSLFASLFLQPATFKQATFKLLQNISMEVQRGNIASILGTLPTPKSFNQLYYEFRLFRYWSYTMNKTSLTWFALAFRRTTWWWRWSESPGSSAFSPSTLGRTFSVPRRWLGCPANKTNAQ